MLLELLPELRERVLSCCPVRDLSNLSCTNSVYRDALKDVLNHAIHIKKLEDAFPLTADRETKRVADERRKNLIYTRKLRISAPEFSAHAFQAIKFNPVALVELVLVCKVDDKLFAVICHSFPGLKKLTLVNPFLTTDGIQCISLLSTLEDFSLHRTFCIDSYSQIFALKTLKKLYLGRCLISSEFAKIGSHLEALSLVECKQITTTGLECLPRETSLKELQLIRNEVTAAGLQHLISFASIVRLTLIKCENLDDVCFSLLSTLPSLCDLTVRGCYSLTTDAYDSFTAMCSLKRLDLSYMHINSSGIERIVGLRDLQELVLDSCCFLGDSGFRSIFTTMVSLRRLNLRNCRISDAGFPLDVHADGSLGPIKLEELNLNSCEQVTEMGVRYIATTFLSLKKLNLGKCHRIAASAFSHLHSLGKLECLNLSYLDEVNDDVVVDICKLSTLRSLDLQRCCSITEQSLELIMESLPVLCELNISECTSLSNEQVNYYKALPKVSVQW